MKKQWFEQFFAEDYCKVYAPSIEKRTSIEVDFIKGITGPANGQKMLDLCCGYGRHVSALANEGYTVCGLDLSPHMVRLAGALPVVLADMRKMPFRDESFDLVYNLFTSFGYFEDKKDDEKAMSEASRVLRSQGTFVIDLRNPVRPVPEKIDYMVDDVRVSECYRTSNGIIRGERQIQYPSGEIRQLPSAVRLYPLECLAQMLDGAGLRVAKVMGDVDGSLYSDKSPRLVVQAVKSA